MSTIPPPLTAALPGQPKLPTEVVRWLPELGQFFAPFKDRLEVCSASLKIDPGAVAQN